MKISLVAVIVLLLVLIFNATIRRYLNESLYSSFIRLLRRARRTNPWFLTKETINHRQRIRDEIEEHMNESSNTNGIEVLLTDALRGGRTYGENKKFLGFVKKYHSEKVIITDYYDKLMQVSTDMGCKVRYSPQKNKWERVEDGESGVTAVLMGELDYDNVVEIDWKSSKSDNMPTLYYNYPFFKTFEREFFATHKGGRRFKELNNEDDVS